MLQVSELFIYPIKSLSGISLTRAKITATGFEYDRRWLLVDEHNNFITQREYHQMALLAVSIEDSGLRVTHKFNKASVFVPFNDASKEYEKVVVRIWDDICEAEFVSIEADEWFSKMLGLKCRLVYMPDSTRRIVDQRYAPDDSITSFADAFPFMMIGQASLDELNSRMSAPLPMDRFRPNIVFTGDEPFAEDMYGHFKIAGIDFYGVKLCARCVMTTVDQETAIKGKEPLKTLARYRFKNNKILFGQNLVHNGIGEIAVGDELTVLKKNAGERFMV
ncbi:MAG TPA: MOSC N-terminal beta barrel domain-containing protein [Mucilaginibacter sp.]